MQDYEGCLGDGLSDLCWSLLTQDILILFCAIYCTRSNSWRKS